MTTFFLGTHEPSWLARAGVPLFVSRRRLNRYRRALPVAVAPWALDSGGFTELSMNGRWSITPARYAADVRRYAEEVGRLDWAAPMDWMCEPFVTTKTGLTVADHQRRTIDNYLELTALAPDLPFVPVLQGWTLDDYLACVDLYADAGVALTGERVVGIGSVCRRQHAAEIDSIVSAVAGLGIHLHGFGVKARGLDRYGPLLASADSMAWSYAARRRRVLAGCSHKTCANCLRWALQWRSEVVAGLEHGQGRLLLGWAS